MANKGILYLIPNVIAADTQDKVIPPHTKSELLGIRCFLAENIRTARRFLSSLKIYDSIEKLQFEVLDKDTPHAQLSKLMNPVMEGNHIGIISESGCPGVADPGSLAVNYAHQHGIRVIPLVGPSSILLALMASGLNGQSFAFHGYLPINENEAGRIIKSLEKESQKNNQTQIFIETPYRNNSIFKSLIKNLNPAARLCVALDMTGSSEQIITCTIKQWKTQSIEWPKLPAVFLFLSGNERPFF